jgi:hypothetical protein
LASANFQRSKEEKVEDEMALLKIRNEELEKKKQKFHQVTILLISHSAEKVWAISILFFILFFYPIFILFFEILDEFKSAVPNVDQLINNGMA